MILIVAKLVILCISWLVKQGHITEGEAKAMERTFDDAEKRAKGAGEARDAANRTNADPERLRDTDENELRD